MVQILHQRYPDKSIYAAGFSLGGNVILKYLGEQGEKMHDYNFKGAAVISVLFDPTTSQHKLNAGFNHMVYSKVSDYCFFSLFIGLTGFGVMQNALSRLIAKAEKQHKQFPTAFDIEAVRKCKTIREFEDAYLVKIYGFQDRDDYYRQCDSKWFLSSIRVPTFAISAIDDPFVDHTSLPTQEVVGNKAPVRLIYHPHGGHCGFSTDRMSVEEDAPPVPSHGWIAEEIARCLQHIRQQ